jgi:hypothetical protein
MLVFLSDYVPRFAESVGGRYPDRGASGVVDLSLALRSGKLFPCRAGNRRTKVNRMHRCLIASSVNVFVRIPETFSSCTRSFVLTSSGNLSTILSVSSSVSGETRTPFDLQRLRALSASQSTPRIVQDFKTVLVRVHLRKVTGSSDPSGNISEPVHTSVN